MWLADLLARYPRAQTAVLSLFAVVLIVVLTIDISRLIAHVDVDWLWIGVGLVVGLAYLLAMRRTRRTGLLRAGLVVTSFFLLVLLVPRNGSYFLRSEYRLTIAAFLVEVALAALCGLLLVPLLRRRRSVEPVAEEAYGRYRGEKLPVEPRGTDRSDPSTSVWNPSDEERRAHLVKIYDVRPLPDDPKPYDPYFVAICACDWTGTPCDSADDAIRDAQKHHSKNIQPELVRPLG